MSGRVIAVHSPGDIVTTFGQFFDLVAARPEAAGSHRYSMKHEWLSKMTAEEWEALRDSKLTCKLFDAFGRKQRDYLNMNAAFIPSDSAFNEVHDSTMRFIGAIMEVGRECGLEPATDWVTARVPNPPELEKMKNDTRALRKPYNCSVYRIAKAVDSSLLDIFVEIWQSPEQQVGSGHWPPGELVSVVGGDTRGEVVGKLTTLREEHKIVITTSWPFNGLGQPLVFHTT